MRKKLLRTLLAGLLFSALFSVTAYAENAVVTGENVNLRSGPGMNYRVVDTIPRGAAITVEDRSNDDWTAVTYNGTYGFMSSNLLTLAENPFQVTVVATEGSGRINAMYVRFRSAPASDASILGEYNVGKELRITGNAGDWTECIIDGQTGYVHNDYIMIETNGAVVVLDKPQTQAAPAKSDTVTPDAPKATPKPTAAPKATPKPTAAPTKAPEVKKTESKTGYIDGDYVSFRNGPSNNSVIINTYNRGKELTITGTSGEWSVVNIDGQTGYVYSSLIKTGSPTASKAETPASTAAPVKTKNGHITANHVQLRSGPSMNSKILGEFFYGDNVGITGTSGEWTGVVYKDLSGYVFSDYVAKGKFKSPAAEKVASGQKITGRDVADFALQYVGYNYRWGGAAPSTGFDCSGFTSYVYKQFGYELNRVACDQARNGKHVDNDKLEPGDILCFYSSGSYIGHVGLYIGDNMFVHAANSSTGVITSSVTGYYAARGFTARRIL